MNRAPHTLVHYLRDLANDFHTYYSAHQFLVDDAALRDARVSLAFAAQVVIRNGLRLLGVSRARHACRSGWPGTTSRGASRRVHSPDGSASRCGLAAGLAVAALVYVKDHKPPTSATQLTKSEKKRPRNAEQPPDPDGAGATAARRLGQVLRFLLEPSEVRGGGPGEGEGRATGHPRRPGDAPRHLCAAGGLVQEFRRRRPRARASSPCRASSPRCRRSPWTTTPGTGSASVRSRSWIELNRLRAVLRKADVDVLVIRVGD